MVHLHNGILCSRKKEGAPTLCDSMDETGEHYAKWNKSGGKGQIPDDLTYKWNLIKKTKQNITRGTQIKNKLTVTRVEVGGDNGGNGGRVFRNIYKGHVDKTKGVWDQGWELGMAGVGGMVGGKGNKKKENVKIHLFPLKIVSLTRYKNCKWYKVTLWQLALLEVAWAVDVSITFLWMYWSLRSTNYGLPVNRRS